MKKVGPLPQHFFGDHIDVHDLTLKVWRKGTIAAVVIKDDQVAYDVVFDNIMPLPDGVTVNAAPGVDRAPSPLRVLNANSNSRMKGIPQRFIRRRLRPFVVSADISGGQVCTFSSPSPPSSSSSSLPLLLSLLSLPLFYPCTCSCPCGVCHTHVRPTVRPAARPATDQENVKIRCVNAVDDCDLIDEGVEYISTSIVTDPAMRLLQPGTPCSCMCVEGTGCMAAKPDVRACACMQIGPTAAYKWAGDRLVMPKHVENGVRECHGSCMCAASSRCGNVLLTKGITLPLEVFRTQWKGWYVRRRVWHVCCPPRR